MKTAILVDGGFYRRHAYSVLGDLSPEDRAQELYDYCQKHLHYKGRSSELYRILYYDCLPSSKRVYHPFLKRQIDLAKNPTYKWSMDFFNSLKTKRKFAIRLGMLSEATAHYIIKPDITKKLCAGTKQFSDLTETDFQFKCEQKGVDMKIGLDIASMAYKKQVDQIILISGDSDFVPAAKLARREGIDFILDPLFATIKPELLEHVDGIRTCDGRYHPNYKNKQSCLRQDEI